MKQLMSEMNPKGSSTNYVTQFRVIFDPLPPTELLFALCPSIMLQPTPYPLTVLRSLWTVPKGWALEKKTHLAK